MKVGGYIGIFIRTTYKKQKKSKNGYIYILYIKHSKLPTLYLSYGSNIKLVNYTADLILHNML